MTIATEPKRLQCRYKGRTEHIPEIWLAGRARTRQREGLTLGDAYTQAIVDWFEQADLAAQYEREGGSQQ